MTSGEELRDIATLAQNPLLAGLSLDEVGSLLSRLEVIPVTAGSVASNERGLCFVLSGELELRDSSAEPRRLVAGDVFGELSLWDARAGATILARSVLRLARLRPAAYAELAATSPKTALHLTHGILGLLSQGSAGAPRPRSGSVAVHEQAAPGSVRYLKDVLPPEIDGALVVAGRIGERLLSLSAIFDGAPVVPVTTRDWEGRDVYRRSAGLVLLECARQLGIDLRLGPSITSGRLAVALPLGDRSTHARELGLRLAEAVRAAAPIVPELWSVPDAIELFRRQNDPAAVLLLEDRLGPLVSVSRCGETRAVVPEPLLPHSGMLEGVRVLEHPNGLLLDFGPRIREALAVPPKSTLALELTAPRYGAPMTLSEAEWLRHSGVDSVGTFNRVCVSGKVAELIRVSEGFHEKRIADLADGIQRRAGVRLVAVAGPSSSGKTTFIKRLLVQLRVNGIDPIELSLDDYYLDRERQVPGPDGELDFERLDALDVAQLREDLDALLRGEAVRPPRYDFRNGLSRPEAGAELRLGERNLLLLEGIHALNPELYGALRAHRAFNVFVHPATALPFDRLSSLEPAEVRLLRRLVRDRHQRGFATVDTLSRWPQVRRAERLHIYPYQAEADVVFDSSLVYEMSVLRVYAERYLLEVPRASAVAPSARRLRELLQQFVPIHPDHVPPTSILREFIGGSGFTY